MTTKAEWKARAKAAEARLPLSEPMPTFDTLTVCFSARTVSFRHHTITTESDCLAFPVTSDEHLFARWDWVEVGRGLDS